MESEKQELSKVKERYGIQWKHLGTHNKHPSVLNYKKQEREKEVAKLDQALSDKKAELSEIVNQQILAEQETERIRKEGKAVRQEVSELSATNHLLKKQDEDAKGQLPEPSMLMSAKSYWEKNVVPLVIKLKDTVKSLTIKCVKITE